MGLLVECPECKKRNSQKAKNCKCGFALAKFSGRVWWIEYYDHEKRLRRERIGPNKAAAEQRYREVMSARTEGRYIKKSPDATTLFRDIARWYLDLPEVMAKRSYRRDCEVVANLLRYFGDRLLQTILPATIEAYRQARLATVAPATTDREIGLLKTIFNKGVSNGKADRNPAQGVKLLRPDNARTRILSPDEYARFLAYCPANLLPIIKLAHGSAMRQDEILSLTWEKIDLREGFIKLEVEDTKGKAKRIIPLTRELLAMLKDMPRGLPGVLVFTFRSAASVQRAFATACKKAGIPYGQKTENGVIFHDLRRTCINARRVQGHDYFRIMAVSGHKSMNIFKMYNAVSRDELQAMVNGKSE